MKAGRQKPALPQQIDSCLPVCAKTLRGIQQIKSTLPLPALYPAIPALYLAIPALYLAIPALYPAIPALYPAIPALYPAIPALYLAIPAKAGIQHTKRALRAPSQE